MSSYSNLLENVLSKGPLRKVCKKAMSEAKIYGKANRIDQ